MGEFFPGKVRFSLTKRTWTSDVPLTNGTDSEESM
jgi:hypothetical protein